MSNFIIEAEQKDKLLLPSFDFGDTAIRLIEFYKFWHRADNPYSYTMFDVTGSNNKAVIERMKAYDDNTIPIGSVEFVLDWFKARGIQNIKPLNIPRELWHFCNREVTIDRLGNLNGKYFIKSLDEIKSNLNRFEILDKTSTDSNSYFASEWVEDVISEWRVFVYRHEIEDIRCYQGDFWKMPDKDYIERITKIYDNPVYTLDVMVTKDGTDIVELHDFFSCGLYGFEHSILLRMWNDCIKNLLKKYGATL